MHFGVADYSAFNKARTVVIGGLNPDYPGDQWHFPLSRMTVACRAYGLRPIDGPFGGIDDPEGYKAAARRGAALGMEGKWAIHPSQIELANDVYSPTAKEVERAERILVALKEAEAQGKGAASLDGKMIDAASEKMARNLLVTANSIKAAAAARSTVIKKLDRNTDPKEVQEMDIHEYQAKELLSKFGVPIPRGGLAYSPEQATYRASELGGAVVVKAQIHSGARGKAGGIKVCKNEHEISDAAEFLLGRKLVTHQTGPARQARVAPLHRGSDEHRPGDLSRLRDGSCFRAHRRRGVRRRRHGHRGDLGNAA